MLSKSTSSTLVIFLFALGLGYGQHGKKMPSTNIDLSKYEIKGIKVDHHEVSVPSSTFVQANYQSLAGHLLMLDPVIDVAHSSRTGTSLMLDGTWNAKSKARGLTKSTLRTSLLTYALERIGEKKAINFEEKSQVTRHGINHYRYQRVFDGVPIWGNEVTVHEKGEQISLTGNIGHFDVEEIIEPISMHDAKKLALDDITKDKIKILDQDKSISFELYLEEDQETLVWYQEDGKWTLAWHLIIHPNLASRWEYFVNAENGQMLHKYESLCKLNHNHGEFYFNEPSTGSGEDLNGSAKTVQTWFYQGFHILMDASRTDMFNSFQSVMPNKPVGVILTLDALNTFPGNDGFKVEDLISQSTTWNNPAAVAAHSNAATAYEYFKDVHRRISINGQGGNIISLINVADEDGKDMDNAFWNGKAIFYGNGDVAFSSLARSVDVAAHELTHGVIQTTANLEYQGESGALNESFADVFAVLIDRDDWTIGEEVVNPNIFKTGALRDLKDPKNGGTRLGDPGYQPDHYQSRFTGRDDNGGVHINSGIPNRAFYLFATEVGREIAEQVYFSVLTDYLTRSSQFVDLRVAVIDASSKMFNGSVAQAAANAFDQVGILGDEPGDYTTDEESNPGEDFILITDDDESNLRIIDPEGMELTSEPLATFGVNNPPSVSDNGELMVYVAADKTMRLIQFDWQESTATSSILEENPIWRNLAISKDGNRLAAITDTRSDSIFIFDLIGGTLRIYELANPTTANGLDIDTDEALFADAMEWDHSGEWLMYDSFNSIEKDLTEDDDITYWDINFMRVWDNTNNTYGDGAVSKLFSGLPENLSVANPTFSKNSPYIIAIDEFNDTPGEQTLNVLGINIETGDIKTIFENNQFGFPSFSKADDRIIFNADDTDGNTVVGQVGLAPSKIEASGEASVLIGPSKWGVWFGNGERDLMTSTLDPAFADRTKVFPNPTAGFVQIQADWLDTFQDQRIEVRSISGQVLNQSIPAQYSSDGLRIDLRPMPPGLYFLKIYSGQQSHVVKIVRN